MPNEIEQQLAEITSTLRRGNGPVSAVTKGKIASDDSIIGNADALARAIEENAENVLELTKKFVEDSKGFANEIREHAQQEQERVTLFTQRINDAGNEIVGARKKFLGQQRENNDASIPAASADAGAAPR